jgi:hypothetical protein
MVSAPRSAVAACLLIAACGSRSGLGLDFEALAGAGGSALGGSGGGSGAAGSGGSGGGVVGGSGGSDPPDAGSALCPAGSAPVVLAAGAQTADAHGIALDAGFVYFTRAPYTSAGAVMRVSRFGGSLESLAPSESRPRRLVLDDAFVYFTAPLASAVKRVRKDGSELSELAAGQHTAEGIAVDSTHVYWVRGNSLDGKLMRLALPDGEPEVLVDQINGSRALELRDGWLYYTAGSTSTNLSPRILRFHRGWVPGSEPELLALVDLQMHDISVDDAHVYFTDNLALGRVPIGGGPAEILFDAGYFLRGVHATPTHVYFAESAGAGAPAGRIHRYSKATGELVAIATEQHVPRDVIADMECTYWTNSGFQTSGGAVMRGPL